MAERSIQSMLQDRASLVKEMESLLTAIENEERDLTDEESKQYAKWENELDEIDETIKTQKGIEARRVRLAAAKAPVGTIVRPQQERANLDPWSYRSLFPKEVEGSAGFKDIQEFMRVVASRRHDPRLDECRTMIEGDGPSAGYAVPPGFRPQLLDVPIASEVVRPRAQVIPQDTATQTHPVFDDADMSSAYAGLSDETVAEGATFSEKEVKLRMVERTARKRGFLVKLSGELYSDAPYFRDALTRKMSETLRAGMDKLFLTGTGVGQPRGILNSPAAVTVNRAGASAISYADITNMWARFHAGFENPVWLANRSAIPQLAAVTDAGSNNVWAMNSALEMPTTIFGAPLIITNRIPALGTKGDLVLVDFQSYIIGLRSEITIQFSEHAYFPQDIVAFRIAARFDGDCYLDKPVTPEDGGATQSPIVILDVP